MQSIQAVLFDLDGTLLDTAPDLGSALNHLRQEENLPPLPIESYRPIISQGAKGLLKFALGIEEAHVNFALRRERFLNYYQQHIADTSSLFPRMEAVLTHLNKLNMPWGIVTNKYTQYTQALLTALPLPYEPLCLVCGDTLNTYKPSPDPLFLAAKLLKKIPESCIYIGDALTDVQASKAAGMRALVAMYGYIGKEDKPQEWAADGYIHDPLDIISWIQANR